MEVGLYGKLPTHGDFLRRRVPDAFVVAWDRWLQASISHSRASLGDRWLDVYLTSPAWRFACSAGACGSDAVAGLMVPSVDRVGRYFPLTLAWMPPAGVTPIDVATRADRWFTAAEYHAIETLGSEQVDFEIFDQQLVALGDQLDDVFRPTNVELDPVDAEAVTAASAVPWQVPLSRTGDIAQVFQQLLYHRLRGSFDPLVLWWTEGSSLVAPSCLITRGLPRAESFAAFLDGSWSDHGWQRAGATLCQPESLADTLIENPPVSQFLSAGLSDTGLARKTNQDAFLERPEAGMWVVADGMGGHDDGDVASRAVCDAIADLVPADTFEATVDIARDRLEAVNSHLRRGTRQSPGRTQPGSTVVVLLARRALLAVLWAGDSRAYRLRAGSLQLLTHDHAAGPDDPDEVAAPGDALAITRAVGGADELELDVHRDRVRRGDRYLLCSDGLTRELDDTRLTSILSDGDAGACVRQLVRETISAGAHDNVTVVVIDAV
ncbi:MAG TPA: type VI secretion system-associated protein TagF [Steroidobacteraceae bacterium]|nr:type VI secretion system-associated protein TagF [Steroidobacteraceae bacterium]